MSFGFSAGDFLAIIELANKIRRDFVGAPEQFQQITAEVRNLTIVLNDIDVSLNVHDLSEAQAKSLHDIRESCQHVLEDTQKTLNKYSSLASKSADFRERAKRVWKRVKWEPDEVRDLRSRISSNVTVLNSFTAAHTRDTVFKLELRQDHQEQQEILEWLTPVDTGAQQSDFIRRRQPGSGQWLVESREYGKWKATKGEILFCHGMPGAGKTILSSIVVNNLQESDTNKDVAVCYFYCNFQRQDEQRLENIVLGFLKQLAQITTPMPTCLKDLFYRCKAKGGRPSLEESINTLYSVARTFSRIFVVVDALDECQTTEGCQRQLISQLIELKTLIGANILATSRPVPHILGRFKEFVLLEVLASPGDIRKYVVGNMQDLPGFVSRNPNLINEITDKIVAATNGMFLLATLHLESLKGKRSPRELRKTLDNLAKGANAYTEAYRNTMLRICGQLQEQKELAIQALIWIVHAKRALTTSELQHALSVQAGELEFYEDNMPDLEDTISACCGLVTVDEGRGIVRLIHYTAQEFFEGQGASYLPNAHVEIANTCVTYLSFGEFNSGPCQQERDFDQRLAQFSLFEYSSHYWGHHLNGLEQSELVQEFLDRPNQVQGSSQALLVDKWRWKYLEKAPSQVTGLHLAAYFGISVSMVKKILTKSHIDAQDSHRRTPLLYASERGHEAIVDLLLENNAQVDTKDTQYGRTPLSWAAKNGHEAIVHLLLEKNAQVDTKDAEYGRTPLSWAARNGYKAIVRLLLKKNAQVDVNDIEYDRTPLLWAAKNGHEGVVRLLLEKNAQVDAEDTEYGQTSLSWAAKNGYEAIVRLLLQKMAQVDAQDTGYGRMPVSWAAENGHEGIVRLLLENNAQVDTQDTQHGRTPVSWAAENGHEAVVRLLLEKNVQVNTPDKNGWTPLLWATEKGHEAIVRLLLERNIQIDTPAENGWTPLLWATKKGHEGIVRVLLENNVQVDTPDKKGRTPLLWAAQKGYEGIVHLLLERNAQVDAKDTKHGRTSLSWAAGNGHEAVVRALLKYGAHAQSSDRRHCTVLFYAILAGKSQIVSILTDLVADIDVKDYYGSSLVSVAARLGHAAIVQQLVRVPSIDAVSADQFGRAPIWWANNQGHKSIVRDLAGFCGASDLKLLLNTPDVCHPFNFTLKGRSCDVCLAATGEKYHHCESCLGGDFDICDRCYNLGAHCLDRSHILV